MSKKISVIGITLLVAAAVLFGFVLVNKGDGPVMGMIISDKILVNVQDFKTINSFKDSGVYLTLEKEYNKFNEKFIDDIPAGKDLYANIHLVECPKGSKLTARWINKGKTVKEETKVLATDKNGVVSYIFDGSKAKRGDYTLELYSEDKKIFEHKFSID